MQAPAFLPFIILLWMAWGFPGSAQGSRDRLGWAAHQLQSSPPIVGTGVRDDLTPNCLG